MRMEKAKKLLQESEFKIYEISEICGYNSVKHFISAFKKYTGTTPMQYKNINGWIKKTNPRDRRKYGHEGVLLL